MSDGGNLGMAHFRYRDDVAAYALGALDEREARMLEEHLRECRSCSEYLLWLDPALELLPESAPQRKPPASLKTGIMEAVREDVRAAERADRGEPGGWRSWLGVAWRPATAVALALILVAGVVTGYALRGEDDESRIVAAVAVGPVAGSNSAAELEVEGGRGTLHVERMPLLAQNRVYQAWVQRDGVMSPSTTFVVRRDGSNEVAIDGDLDGADGVYIPREPVGGSERPTLPVLMKAPLT